MPRAAADSVIIITSSSSSEEEGDGRGGSTSSARHAHYSAAAAASVGGKNGDGVRKKKERKEREKGTGAVPSGEGRRGGEESGREKKPKKKKNKEEEKENKAPFASVYARDSAASGGNFAPLSIIFALPASPVKRPRAGSKGGGGNGGRSMDRVRKEKRKEREEGTSAVGGGELRREGEETKEKGKRKNEENKKKATHPTHCAGDVVANGAELGHHCPTGGSATDPAMRLVAKSAGRSVNSGGKNTDGVRKKKSKDGEVETSAVANGKVRREGEERKTKVKKKDKNREETEKKAASPSSYSGDVVATSDEVGRPSSTCIFPMLRVKRLIAGSEDGGSNCRKGSVRTSLDAVFLINKASELFLELFTQDAYAHATQEHKKALFYKFLSSTVCDRKRYEFLSDFVPEKLRAEDALKALTEQPRSSWTV